MSNGTIKQARINAQEWFDHMKEDGFVDIVMTEGNHGDYFEFIFTHKVTKKVATLHIHGYPNNQTIDMIFKKIYWNGCSSSEPKIDNWLKDGFTFEIKIKVKEND